MKITYKTDLPEPTAFYELFKTTGWDPDSFYPQEQLFRAIQQSWYALSAYQDELLVGFGRVLSDGVLHALIVEMIIHPDHQGQKIGSIILQKLIMHCKAAKIKQIQLFAAKEKSGFYEKFGFFCRPDDAPGMEFDNNFPIENPL